MQNILRRNIKWSYNIVNVLEPLIQKLEGGTTIKVCVFNNVNVFAMGFQKVGNDGTTRVYGTTGSPVFTPGF
jgi:predicted NBD/HSP70 family sugar kinase